MSFTIPVNDGIDDALSLRLIEPRHAQEILDAVLSSRDSIARWMPWCHERTGIDDVREFAKKSLRGFADRKKLAVSIVLNGRVVGGSGYTPWENVEHPTWGVTAATADVGYWLTDEMRGKGIASRATAALCDYGFNEHGLHRIQIRAETDNDRSRAVPERLGFTYEGTLRRVYRWKDRWIDHRYYSMLPEDWPAAKAAWLQRYAHRLSEPVTSVETEI